MPISGNGGSRPASSTPGRDHQTTRLAHATPHVRDFGQEPRRGRGDYTGAHATRERKHHDGQVRPSCDACQAGSAIAHRAVNSVPIRSRAVDGNGCNCLNIKQWALNSAVECHPHTVEVVGSNPTAPTTRSNRLPALLHSLRDSRGTALVSRTATVICPNQVPAFAQPGGGEGRLASA